MENGKKLLTIDLVKRLLQTYKVNGISQNRAASLMASDLGNGRWSPGYLKTFLYSNPPIPSKEFQIAIKKLAKERRVFPVPPKRYWVKISASEKEKDEWNRRIPMERRSELFREEIERMNQEEKSRG